MEASEEEFEVLCICRRADAKHVYVRCVGFEGEYLQEERLLQHLDMYRAWRAQEEKAKRAGGGAQEACAVVEAEAAADEDEAQYDADDVEQDDNSMENGGDVQDDNKHNRHTDKDEDEGKDKDKAEEQQESRSKKRARAAQAECAPDRKRQNGELKGNAYSQCALSSLCLPAFSRLRGPTKKKIKRAWPQ